MNETFFVSDSHFSHGNIIKYCERPFSSKEEMEEILVDNWNGLVSTKDDVYHLGDFAFLPNGDNGRIELKRILSRLNGRIHLLLGSHDKGLQNQRDLFHETFRRNSIVERKFGDKIIIMGHCPMLSFEKRSHGSIHFFGHVHSGPLKPFLCQNNSCDVGLDSWEFKPVHIDAAVERAQSSYSKLTTHDIYDNSDKENWNKK